MKVNIIVKTPRKKSKKSGIVNSALRFVKNLQKQGIEVHINGKGYDYDIFHFHMPSPDYLYKIKKAKRKGIKIITHAHVTIEDLKGSFTLTENKRFLKMAKKYIIYFYNQGDLVLTPSEWTKKTLINNGVKTPIKVLSNGIENKKFKFSETKRKEFRKEHKIRKNDLVVYSVGMVFLRKGIDTFVSVAKKMPDINFFWIGKKYNSMFVNPRKTNKILKDLPPNCKFLGFVKDIIAAHCGCDMFLFPSYVENQGIVILEAAACESPIIVRDIPVYKDWLFHNKNCLKGVNTDDFVKNIRLLVKDKKIRKKMIKEGKNLASKNDLNLMTKKLIKNYENLLNS